MNDIRERWARVTPGPWRVAHHGTWEVEAPPSVLIADCGTIDRAESDAVAIAHAPSDIQRLLAKVDALEERLRAEERETARRADEGHQQVRAHEEVERQRTKANQKWAAAVDELHAAREAWDGTSRTLKLRLEEVQRERDESRRRVGDLEAEVARLRGEIDL